MLGACIGLVSLRSSQGISKIQRKFGGAKRAGIIICLRKTNLKSSFGKGIFVHHGILSTDKRVEFSSDKVLYVVYSSERSLV